MDFIASLLPCEEITALCENIRYCLEFALPSLACQPNCKVMISPSHKGNKGTILEFHWLCNNINEIVSSGLVILSFIPPFFNRFVVLVYPIKGISPLLSVPQPKARCSV